jgi:DNA end-binding protein Ku
MLWQGSVSFGLVNFPVKMFRALKPPFPFHLFHKKDKGPIRYSHICEKESREIPWEEIVKGYEVREGKYVYLEEKDFVKIYRKKSSIIDVFGFINEYEIDSRLFDKFYYLVGQEKNKAYFLFLDALKESRKVALCRFILHNKEHLAIIKPLGDLLILLQLRYFEEIKNLKALGVKIPLRSKYNNKEFNSAKKIIEELSISFEPQKYKDPYLKNIKEIIKKKKK